MTSLLSVMLACGSLNASLQNRQIMSSLAYCLALPVELEHRVSIPRLPQIRAHACVTEVVQRSELHRGTFVSYPQ